MKKQIIPLVLIPLILMISLIGATLYYYLRNTLDITQQSIIEGNNFYKVFFHNDENELLKITKSNWKHLASFVMAFKYISHSKPKEAASIYNNIANNQSTPNILRELAQYLEVMSLLLSSDKISEDKVSKLAKNSVYPYLSQEAIIIIKINNNDIKNAINMINKLLNNNKYPATIKTNTQELLKIYENHSH